MTIRRSTPADAAAIASIEALTFSDPWAEEDLRRTIEAPYTLCFTAEEDGQGIGYLLTTAIAPEGEVQRIAIHPSYRRRGVARALLDTYLSTARERAISTVYLEVRRQNAPAQALYQATGFEPIGIRRAYYRHPTDDAQLMRLTINDKL